MKIKIKLDEGAILPSYAKDGDAGMDLTALTAKAEGMYTEYGTGVYLEIPKGYVGLIYPRSSISKKAQILANSVAVIDSGYRGEIKLRFKADFKLYSEYVKKMEENPEKDWEAPLYLIGDKIGQLVIVEIPKIQFEHVRQLSNTERGKDGFGSSGK